MNYVILIIAELFWLFNWALVIASLGLLLLVKPYVRFRDKVLYYLTAYLADWQKERTRKVEERKAHIEAKTKNWIVRILYTNVEEIIVMFVRWFVLYHIVLEPIRWLVN